MSFTFWPGKMTYNYFTPYSIIIMIKAIIKMLWVFIMWPSLEVKGSSERQGRWRGRQKELWSVKSSWYTKHGELGVRYRREAKLCWCLGTNSLFSQMRHTKFIWQCMLARDKTPNPEWAKVKMEFISLHEGGEPGVAPAKLDLRAQTMSSDLSVNTISCLCFLLCCLHSSQVSHTYWEIFRLTSSQVQVQENRQVPHFFLAVAEKVSVHLIGSDGNMSLCLNQS